MTPVVSEANLMVLAPTDRKAALAKANAARIQQRAANKALELRRDFLDAPEWDRLAREFGTRESRRRGVRLPAWDIPPTPARMKAWLKRLGISIASYREWSGEKDWNQFRRRNPEWPLRAWAGLVLADSLPATRTPHALLHQATGGAQDVLRKPETRGSPISSSATIHKPLVRMSV